MSAARLRLAYADFITYDPLVMTGDLEGCWYTKVEASKDNGTPSGVYMESGEEVFVGSLNGGPVGTFATSYKFESKWDPDVSAARRSTDVASTHSSRAAAPTGLRAPLAESTSRTT